MKTDWIPNLIDFLTFFLLPWAIIVTFIAFAYFVYRLLSVLWKMGRLKGIQILLGGVTIILFLGLGSYAVTSQTACTICHSQQTSYTKYRKEPHRKTTCASCHKPAGRWGWGKYLASTVTMIPGQLLNLYPRPILADIDNQKCLKCHPQVGAILIIGQEFEVQHFDFLKKYRCTDCHGEVGHRSKHNVVDKKTACLSCHDGLEASDECDSCHRFPVEGKIPKKGMLGFAHKNNAKNHKLGTLSTCKLCHQSNFCSKCHLPLPHPEEFPFLHGKMAQVKQGNCTQCHKPKFCTSCHQVDLPHPRDWRTRHPAEAKKLGAEKCLTCHQSNFCSQCHELHKQHLNVTGANVRKLEK